MKKLFNVFMSAALALSMSVTAFAETPKVTDLTGLIDAETISYYGEDLLPSIEEQFGVDIRVEFVDDIGGQDILDYASERVELANIGGNTDYNYFFLVVDLGYSGDDLFVEDYGVTMYMDTEENIVDPVFDAAVPYLEDAMWAGDNASDNETAIGLIDAFGLAALNTFAEITGIAPDEETAEEPTVGMQEPVVEDITPNVSSTSNFYMDTIVVMPEEVAEINSHLESVSKAHNTGVYLAVVDDYTDYGSNIEQATENIFEMNNFGVGGDKSGIMLTLSMSERDYYVLIHGDDAHYAFSDFAIEVLESEFLDDFGNDDYYAGFRDFGYSTDAILSMADDGTPLDKESDPTYTGLKWLVSLVIGVIVGFLIAAAIRSRMNNVAERAEAAEYVEERGIDINNRQDRFTHITTVRHRIKSDDDDNHSSGYSGSGGKF